MSSRRSGGVTGVAANGIVNEDARGIHVVEGISGSFVVEGVKEIIARFVAEVLEGSTVRLRGGLISNGLSQYSSNGKPYHSARRSKSFFASSSAYLLAFALHSIPFFGCVGTALGTPGSVTLVFPISSLKFRISRLGDCLYLPLLPSPRSTSSRLVSKPRNSVWNPSSLSLDLTVLPRMHRLLCSVFICCRGWG